MIGSRTCFFAACLLFVQAASSFAFAGGELPERSDVPDEFKWRLSDIYASDADWEREYETVRAEIPKLSALRGTLGKSASDLLACLRKNDEIAVLLGKLYVYANMKSHEDTANATYQAMANRAGTLAVAFSAAASFVTPEIIAIPEKKLRIFLYGSTAEDFADHRFNIEEILRTKAHVLSVAEETILARAGDMAGVPENAFSMLTNADMKFPSIRDEKGKKVELTEERYIKYISSRNREVRKAAFEALYATYGKNLNTLGATFNGMLKTSRFYADARRYESDLAAALDGPNIPLSVYANLVDTIESNLKPLHRYMALRKKALGVGKLHMYDVYVPLVKSPYREVSWEEAKKIALSALRPLGDDYMKQFERGLESGWIDVYPNRGKRGGAYSWGSYRTHPYILLNFNGEFNDIMTLVHEMGHSMHSYYSRKNQPYPTSDYTMFCAEVASTTNEELTLNYLLDGETDRKKRIYLLNQRLERIRSTIYRQTMFASFERAVHERNRRGEDTTAEELGRMWKALNAKYFGPGVVIDDGIAMEWARIPHFYTPFYVYVYATSYSAAASLAKGILAEGTPAVERYIRYLSSGSSKNSIELLREAGVDMSTPKPILDAIGLFDETLDEMERLLEE